MELIIVFLIIAYAFILIKKYEKLIFDFNNLKYTIKFYSIKISDYTQSQIEVRDYFRDID